MYRDISKNELRKEKQGTLKTLKKIAEENISTQEEANELKQENESLMATIKRYREMILNFDEEYGAVKQYADRKNKQRRWGKAETTHT